MKKLAVRLFAFVLTLMLMFSACAAANAQVELAEGADLRVMSFNVLHPGWSHVALAGRDAIAIAIMQNYMPDVIALQEASQTWHQAIGPAMTDYAFACRKSNGNQYCVTTFIYNTNTVKLVEEYILDLDAKDAARVLSVAVFERLSDSVQFVVTNTHPAPTDQPENYARNIADLQNYAVELTTKYADLPVIMAGDFNSGDRSEVYANLLAATGLRDAKFVADVMVRDHITYGGWQTEPEYEKDYAVDHIFVNDKIDVKLFEVIIDQDVRNATDHFPLYADLDLK